MIKSLMQPWKTEKKKGISKMDLVRLFTAGNVDDGKSTLIGRLLLDSNRILKDQLRAVKVASVKQGLDDVNLALFTDGLRDERDLGITIDVAYRYFATPKRKFILADTPGHVQYTRNMVTGASNANVAIILVDARKGLVEQSKRHCFIASLLRIPHLIIAVNKMDLVGYSAEAFQKVIADFEAYSSKLEITDVKYIPVSALKGDNIVNPSNEMSWYHGPSMMEMLDSVHISSDRNYIDFRMPVQLVQRRFVSDSDQERVVMGAICSGALRAGDEIEILPQKIRTQVKKLTSKGISADVVFAPMAVELTTTEEIDIKRGDFIVRPNNQPEIVSEVTAMICWMSEADLQENQKLLMRFTTSELQVIVKEIIYVMDVESLHKDQTKKHFSLNDIGKVRIKLSREVAVDKYRLNRSTGSFILVDPVSNNTVAAGMIS